MDFQQSLIIEATHKLIFDKSQLYQHCIFNGNNECRQIFDFYTKMSGMKLPKNKKEQEEEEEEEEEKLINSKQTESLDQNTNNKKVFF
ncbi:hypothetical protein M0812_26839 [Anaeramoeba flamelloides]|uniref:Uncharacterized protein n=1 Tax=Anaeramoeba flamelloides TaxID=1746091 RepID=A0AAV7YCP1_9EUKA|nr:hypothetical protein M0812_26839 [Anaeramoeba flamelloides]